MIFRDRNDSENPLLQPTYPHAAACCPSRAISSLLATTTLIHSMAESWSFYSFLILYMHDNNVFFRREPFCELRLADMLVAVSTHGLQLATET